MYEQPKQVTRRAFTKIAVGGLAAAATDLAFSDSQLRAEQIESPLPKQEEQDLKAESNGAGKTNELKDPDFEDLEFNLPRIREHYRDKLPLSKESYRRKTQRAAEDLLEEWAIPEPLRDLPEIPSRSFREKYLEDRLGIKDEAEQSKNAPTFSRTTLVASAVFAFLGGWIAHGAVLGRKLIHQNREIGKLEGELYATQISERLHRKRTHYLEQRLAEAAHQNSISEKRVRAYRKPFQAIFGYLNRNEHD